MSSGGGLDSWCTVTLRTESVGYHRKLLSEKLSESAGTNTDFCQTIQQIRANSLKYPLSKVSKLL